ncbi:MAG: hypothetical protein LBU47_00350 [Christensenellaceae bacterium]|nr:hypothetical protein [Christensenellaceae bacterium]
MGYVVIARSKSDEAIQKEDFISEEKRWIASLPFAMTGYAVIARSASDEAIK